MLITCCVYVTEFNLFYYFLIFSRWMTLTWLKRTKLKKDIRETISIYVV